MPTLEEAKAQYPELAQYLDSGDHYLRWLLPRLVGTVEEKEITLTMILAREHDSFCRGIHDAGLVAQRVADTKPESRDLRIMARALVELEARNRESEVDGRKL